MLVLDLRLGERVSIGDTTVRLERKSGQMVRLVIDADKAVRIRLEPDGKPHECSQETKTNRRR